MRRSPGTLLALLVLLACPAAAAAYPYTTTVAYWHGTQRPDGTIAGPTGRVEGYGTIMMGAAFSQAGLRPAAALAATNWIAKGPDDPFSILAATVVYERADAPLRAALAPVIRARLASTLPLRLTTYANNWALVEAAAAIRAERLGLGTYRATVDPWITANYLPVLQATGGYGGDALTWPLAYHALATAFLAVVADGSPSAVLRVAALRSCWVLERTVSPTGAVAWYGRSQLESFSQAAAVLALRTCARFAGPVDVGRFEVVAHRVGVALARSYPTLPSGRMAIIPRYVFDPTPYRGADRYAHEDGYTAFTLVLLGLDPGRRETRAAPVTGYVARLGPAAPAIVAARVHGGWLGLSLRPRWTTLAHSGPRDGRYGFGVQRVETNDHRLIVPAASITSPPDVDLPAATRVTTTAGDVTAWGPGYSIRFWIRGCSVFERVRVRRARVLTIGARIATDAAGLRLGALHTSRKLLYRHFWKSYGADTRRLQNVRGIVRLRARHSVTIERAGCLPVP